MTGAQWPIRHDEISYQKYRAAGAWDDRTLGQKARARAEATPDTVAFLNEKTPSTYAALLSEAEALAASLWKLGLRPGDVMSFQLPNWMESVTLDIAASLIGLVCNPIVPIYRDAEIGPIMKDCGSKAIFAPTVYRGFDFGAMIDRLAPQLPELKHVIFVRNAPAGRLDFAGLIEQGRGQSIPWPVIDPEAIKLILYTSGTTGRAKGVLHNHNTLARIMKVGAAYWGLEEGDVVLMPSPVTHTTGYANGIELPFVVGTRTVFMERWDAAEAVRLIDHYKVNATVGATPFLQELTDAALAAGSSLPSIKVFACGGASVPPGLIRRANDIFERGRAFRVFGSTEAPLVTMGYLGPQEADLAADTDGKIIDYDVKFVDEDGATLPSGQDGEILVRGPCLFAGYTDKAQTDQSFDSEGYFKTGDIGHLTPQHGIVITDRKKDLIIRGGENISAREVEDALDRHPDIAEVAAVSMPHPRLGETICVYVLPRSGTSLTLKSVVDFVAGAGLAKQKYPERLEFVDVFPRTPAGKIRKDVLRKLVAEKIKAEA